jgi:hypothetical protein
MAGGIRLDDYDPRFKIFHDLMQHKILNILLISRQYDAWIMEEDCRLSETIVKEYRGLNLSHPPRLRWVANTRQALRVLGQHRFDLVIIIARGTDTGFEETAAAIKAGGWNIPVILMVHQLTPAPKWPVLAKEVSAIDRTFLWTGNTEVLFALIKNSEDWMNVRQDTHLAGIRVILFVEDSPEYASAILPILYKGLVLQAQAVMDEGLNEEHRLLAMRARPKILLAETFEKAMSLYETYKDNILAVISDMRFPRAGKLDGKAGVKLLETIKAERFDIPLLLVSAESGNQRYAETIPARFVDKSSPTLPSEIRNYFIEDLGFGDFVFRMPDGREIGRAGNLRDLEIMVGRIPVEALRFHSRRNDFSRWLFARSEIELAAGLRPVRNSDFDDVRGHYDYLTTVIHQRRMLRQRGLVVDFDAKRLDLDTEFCKIGGGSLGGKARGLAFMNTLLHQHGRFREKYPDVTIRIPQTVVIATERFEEFIEFNDLQELARLDLNVDTVAGRFMDATMPPGLVEQLRGYLHAFNHCLAVRSSSLLEDAQYRAYAGLYSTYMLPNDHADPECRLGQLVEAVKMVFASTYFPGPKAFSRRVGQRTEEEKMAVIIQQLVGERFGDYFYPALSGVAQSYNYYPIAEMKPQDGVAAVALGLGKSVMGGESSLRFSPKHPLLLPDRSTVHDILKNAQRYFYAVKMGQAACSIGVDDSVTLARREVFDALAEPPVRTLCSTYIPAEGRIRDSIRPSGTPVVTFYPVLKHRLFPLAEMLTDLLRIGEEGMGSPVEMEFCLNLPEGRNRKPEFAILQLRPMGAREELMRVDISDDEIRRSLIYSRQALGNTIAHDIRDIVLVKRDTFDPAQTAAMAGQIGKINAKLVDLKRKYLLIGPGRWGSADRWLGIPVRWEEICGVGAIVEADHPRMQAEPSQGSHFFHNISTLGINYLTALESKGDRIDWQWLDNRPATMDTGHVCLIRLEQPLVLKVDGRQSRAVVCVSDR